MKRALTSLLLGLALAGVPIHATLALPPPKAKPAAAAPAAAPPPPPPLASIKATVVSSGQLHVTVTPQAGVVCAADKAVAEACTGKCSADPGDIVAGAVVQNFDLTPPANVPAPRWLRQALAGAPLWCAQAGAAPPGAKQIDLQVALPSAGAIELDGGLDPEGPTANTLIWSGWQDRSFAPIWRQVGKLATTDTCSVNGVAGSCHVTLTASSFPGTQLVLITYEGAALSSGSVQFTINGQAFHAAILPCHLAPSAALPGSLFAGANLQTLELTGSPTCIRRAMSVPLVLSKDGADLAATARVDVNGTAFRFTLENVPNPVAAGSWALKDPGGTHLGIVLLGAVQKPIEVREASGTLELGIHYEVPNSPLELDQWQDGKSQNGAAVVTAARGEHEQYIQNTAALSVAPELLALARREQHAGWEPPNSSQPPTTPSCTSVVTSCEALEQKYDPEGDCDAGNIEPDESVTLDKCHAARRAWRVKAHSWEDAVWLKEDQWWRNKEPSFQDELGGLTFAVFQQRPDPFIVAIELVDYDPKSESEVVLFRQYVKLANAARYESLPLPLADALVIECGHKKPRDLRSVFPVATPASSDGDADVIRNGYTRAVEDSDVLSGNCRLIYSRALLQRALNLEAGAIGLDILKYYGPQELSVTVRRGEAEQTFPFRIDPSIDKEIELKVPRDAKNATGIYVVSVALKGPALPAVVWRTPQAGTNGSVNDLQDLSFHANLRPRGPFGWKVAPIRAFLTLPVSFTGVRFPARPSEIEASSTSSNVQVTKIQGGALLAVEPWNYDTGRNPWPVPTRFVTGMNVYNISSGKFAPSWVTGVSLTLPIIDLQKGIAEDQLSTDVALGFFWETDVAEHDWIHHGNHFLATFGINLLSLFGSK